ncbi:MAG: sigma 54-interacting transcriptional regulator [Deltaproteobacteria bacterium]|nr:sigma 54-interacting transcriptional regulator [Deltaproteobacteria bacterium]MBN2672396.1 sigma 54-interacting transcriptional regulator [Deltaproteobacteria bacterium]
MKQKNWQQRFADTADLLPVIVCETDRELRITYVNETGFRVTGYDNEDFASGIYLQALIPDEDKHKAGKNLHIILSGQATPAEEYRILHKDGTVGEYQMNSAPIFQNGTVVGVRTCLTDVKERNRFRNQLAQSEEKFRRIFYQSPIAVALFDQEGAIREANSAFAALFPKLSVESEGASLFDLIHISEKGRNVLKQGAVLTGETELSVPDRDLLKNLLFEWTLTPLGTVIDQQLYLLQMLDVTAERQRQKAQEQLIANLRHEAAGKYTYDKMVSRSPKMKQLFAMLGPIADANTTVLITGESGTGKEMVARAIHATGSRKDKPFVAFNCSALPDNLIESELFGYQAGAFTDAKKNKPGKFALAEGGVIFLDEIGDISGSMQAKLLRVLQERTYEPLGATVTARADVRVLAATNRNLPEMVKDGTFREDLYYRLNVLRIPLPPLRERQMDIPALCEHFIQKYNRITGKNILGVGQGAMNILMSCEFPGNIRQLENAIEYAFVFCDGNHIDVSHLPEEIGGRISGRLDNSLARFSSLAELEAVFLRAVIHECNGSKIKAAKRLGIHKTTLFRKLKKYQM